MTVEAGREKPGEDHDDSELARCSRFCKKMQSFDFGCVPLQGIWALYIIVFCGMGFAVGGLWQYNLFQTGRYLEQQEDPYLCVDTDSQHVDLKQTPGYQASMSNFSCYVIVQVHSCGATSPHPKYQEDWCTHASGSPIAPNQLATNRPDSSCTKCYASATSFYRNKPIAEAAEPTCSAVLSDADAQARCAQNMHTTPYRCWLGQEGNEEHGHLLFDEQTRTVVPVIGWTLGGFFGLLFVLYCVKKGREMVIAFHETASPKLSADIAPAPSEVAHGPNDLPCEAVFEFESASQTMSEKQGSLKLTVVKRGTTLNTYRVHYKTENVNMEAACFVAVEGELLFEPSTTNQTFSVEVNRDYEWQHTTVMSVKLNLIAGTSNVLRYSPDQKTRAEIGRLGETTVMIVNSDSFPHALADTNNVPATVRAFFWHVWVFKKRPFLKCLGYKMGQPFCYLVGKLIEYRLLDFTLKKEYTIDYPMYGQWTRDRELAVLASCYMLNFLLGWYMEIWHELWAPFTSMLYMSPHADKDITVGKMYTMMERACEDAVYHAWYTFSMLAGTAITMLVQLGFLAFLGAYDSAYEVLIVLPILVLANFGVYYLRVPPGVELDLEYHRTESERVDWTNDCLRSKDILYRYNQIPAASKKFKDLHTKEMWARFQFLLFDFNTDYISKFLPVCAYCLFMYLGGKHVMNPEDKEFQLSDLVLLLSTVQSFSSSIRQLFVRLRGVARGYLGVEILAEFLNKSNLETHKLQCGTSVNTGSDWDLNGTTNATLQEQLKAEQARIPWQNRTIELRQVTYDYARRSVKPLKSDYTKISSSSDYVPPVRPFTLSLRQGSFTVVTGQEASGKSTLLKLLDGVLPVDNGALYVPESLSTHLVGQDNIDLASRNVLESLTMGCNKIGANADETWPVDQLRTLYNTYSGNFPDPNTPVDELVSFVREGAKQSVAEVAHRFGLTSSITMDAPLHLLSSQQHIMVSIVRALLTECDVLLLDGVFDQLPHDKSQKLGLALAEWQRRRSLGSWHSSFSNPKTIVLVTRDVGRMPELRNLWPSLHIFDTNATFGQAEHAPQLTKPAAHQAPGPQAAQAPTLMASNSRSTPTRPSRQLPELPARQNPPSLSVSGRQPPIISDMSSFSLSESRTRSLTPPRRAPSLLMQPPRLP